ncbi:hypothetical protein [Gryllotalpicola protaetiae]|uniref:Uncharacterized protein n=1 Tax=Gryllotalpicola protaetiae TaxID=2419771 RepID=A0A387BPS0_9MICO|nr:hypothetical protein [Gryllotalpicola protaetiae]AYG03010.1 hypothetical protein D7I44_05375 [Gryllotalpicola protaetiae]
MPEPDDTVRTESHGTIEDTAPVVARRVAQTESVDAKFTVGRALPPQGPPVTDINLLEFRPPEVPAGGVVRYKVRANLVVTQVPDFDAEWKIRQRTPRALSPTDIVAHQNDDRRVWRRRAVIIVGAVSLVVLAAGLAGIWALQQF